MLKKFRVLSMVVFVVAGVACADLIVDGDFETTGGWFATGGVDLDNPENGPSLSGVESAALPRSLGAQQIRSIATPVAPGDVLTLTFDYKVDQPVDWWWQQVRFFTGKDANLNATGWQGEVNTPFQAFANWQSVTVPNIVVPAGVNYIDIIFNAGIFSDNFNGTLVVDNVDIAGSSFPVPEPATLALMGTGLLALIRRKRQ